MTAIKSGDLVVLKSGGPTMTVDTVNTDIFDDNKITGVLCFWFVGEKLERVRFDHRAIEPVRAQKAARRKKGARLQEATGEYKAVLDEMAAAMNVPAEFREGCFRGGCQTTETRTGPKIRCSRCRTGRERPRHSLIIPL